MKAKSGASSYNPSNGDCCVQSGSIVVLHGVPNTYNSHVADGVLEGETVGRGWMEGGREGVWLGL